MSDTEPVSDRDGTTLAPDVRRTLQTALSMGYFDVPRRTTLVDVAEERGLADVEVSEQLRVGTAAVLRRSDALEPEPPSG